MGLAGLTGLAGLAVRRTPEARQASLKVLKIPGTAKTLRGRRGREGTGLHAGRAELMGSAGSTMREFGGHSTRTGRRQRPHLT